MIIVAGFVLFGCATFDPAIVVEKLDTQNGPIQVLFAEYEQQPHLIQIDGSLAQATQYIDKRYLEAYETFMQTFAKEYGVEVVDVRWQFSGGKVEYSKPLEGVQLSVAVYSDHVSAFAGKPDQIELSFVVAVVVNNAKAIMNQRWVASVSGDWLAYNEDPTFLVDAFKAKVKEGTEAFVSSLKD